MGWMTGSPPPLDKQVRFADGSMMRFPQSRWANSHFRELVPTKLIARGHQPVHPLPRAERQDLDAIQFTPIGATAPMSWAESLLANYTDGIVVLHRGQIVYERYLGALDADTAHIAYSVTKSFVGTIAACLVHEGLLDDTAKVAHYVPELAASAFGDATVRQFADQAINFRLGTHVDTPGWFIENQDLTITDKPLGNNDFLLVATRKELDRLGEAGGLDRKGIDKLFSRLADVLGLYHARPIAEPAQTGQHDVGLDVHSHRQAETLAIFR
jgi:hypothetical protein